MALVTVPTVPTASSTPSDAYVSTIHVRSNSYTVPLGHYALVKVIASGTNSTNGQQYFINGVRADVWGEMTISSGIRFPALTAFRTSVNDGPHLIMEIYTV